MIRSDTFYKRTELIEQGIGDETIGEFRAAGIRPVKFGKSGQHWYDGGLIIEFLRRNAKTKKSKPVATDAVGTDG
jgi:hypothetical protein